MYYEIMTLDGWLWYLKNEGKVRREWVYEICRKAGINPFDLTKNVWHKISL